MKIAKPKSKLPVIIALCVVAVAVVAGLGIWYFNSQQASQQNETDSPENINYSPPTQEEQKQTDNHKEEISKPNPEDDQPTDTSLGVTISRASQVGDELSIRTVVTGTKTGSCGITLTKGASKITKSFAIKFEATSASCNGDIKTSEFPAGGEWKLSITAKNGAKASPAVVQKVNINK